jgi:hypothetical protein
MKFLVISTLLFSLASCSFPGGKKLSAFITDDSFKVFENKSCPEVDKVIESLRNTKILEAILVIRSKNSAAHDAGMTSFLNLMSADKLCTGAAKDLKDSIVSAKNAIQDAKDYTKFQEAVNLFEIIMSVFNSLADAVSKKTIVLKEGLSLELLKILHKLLADAQPSFSNTDLDGTHIEFLKSHCANAITCLEKQLAQKNAADGNKNAGTGATLIIVIVAVVLVLAGAGAAIFFIMRRRSL